MISSLLRTVAGLASIVVILSFALFAIDQSRAASNDTQAQIEGRAAATQADPSPSQERARERIHTKVREFVDDVDDDLLAPFAGLVDGSHSQWVRRGIPALLALLVYGVGLGFLARTISVRA